MKKYKQIKSYKKGGVATIDSNTPTGVSVGTRPSALLTQQEKEDADRKTDYTIDKIRKASAAGALIPNPYVQYPSIAVNSMIGLYDTYNDIKENNGSQAALDLITSIPLPFMKTAGLPIKQAKKVMRYNTVAGGMNTIGAVDDYGIIEDSTKRKQYGGAIQNYKKGGVNTPLQPSPYQDMDPAMLQGYQQMQHQTQLLSTPEGRRVFAGEVYQKNKKQKDKEAKIEDNNTRQRMRDKAAQQRVASDPSMFNPSFWKEDPMTGRTGAQRLDDMGTDLQTRVFQTGNKTYDNYLNGPGYIAHMAGNLAKAPAESKRQNSVMPYANALAEPFAVGMGENLVEPFVAPYIKKIGKNIKEAGNFFADRLNYGTNKYLNPENIARLTSSKYKAATQAELDAGNKWLEEWHSDPIIQKRMAMNDLDIPYPWVKSTVEKFAEGKYKPRFINPVNETIEKIHDGNLGVSYSNSKGAFVDRYPQVENTTAFNTKNKSYSGGKKYLPSKIKSTTIHEGTHQIETNGLGLGDEYNNVLKDVFPERNPYTLKLDKEADFFNYHTDPTEVHARINELREHYNIKPADKITHDKAYGIIDDILADKTPVSKYFGKHLNASNGNQIIAAGNLSHAFNRMFGVAAPVGLGAAALSQDNKQYGGTINNNNMKTGGFYQKKGMYWDGTKMVKAKGSGTYSDGTYYQNGGQTPTAFWNLPNPTANPGAAGMVDYGSMYSLPNRGLFQKQTAASEWEGFGNPANLITNQQQQPTQSYQAAGQPLQYATQNKSSFYEGPGENNYSIDAIRQQTMATGGLYMGNRVQYGKGGIHIKKANEGKFTEWAQRHDMGVQEAARHVMANKEDYSSTIVKRANFAKNAAGWNKQYGGIVDQYEQGGMIKRADGSYSQRGLWDNIRANAGSGKQPTREMLEQERKIKANEKRYGGMQYLEGGEIDLDGGVSLPSANNAWGSSTATTQQQMQGVYAGVQQANKEATQVGANSYANRPVVTQERANMNEQPVDASTLNNPYQATPQQPPVQPYRPFGQGFSNFTNAAIAAGGIAGAFKSGKEMQQFGIKNGMTNLNPTAGSRGLYNGQGQLMQQFQPPARYGKHGGMMPAPQYKTGGTYTVSASEIARLRKMGYDIEELS